MLLNCFVYDLENSRLRLRMSTNTTSTNWVHLTSFPSISFIKIPTGTDRNNYIVVDVDVWNSKINCLYKYNIDNNKWIKINGFNNMKNISLFSSAFDANKQILFLSQN
eukprot:384738_1